MKKSRKTPGSKGKPRGVAEQRETECRAVESTFFVFVSAEYVASR